MKQLLGSVLSAAMFAGFLVKAAWATDGAPATRLQDTWSQVVVVLRSYQELIRIMKSR